MRAYFDDFAGAEWERLERDIAGGVSLEVHRQFLKRFINEGDRVLEVGAGPARFTQELIDQGAKVVVTDFSSIPLELIRVRHADSHSISSRDVDTFLLIFRNCHSE